MWFPIYSLIRYPPSLLCFGGFLFCFVFLWCCCLQTVLSKFHWQLASALAMLVGRPDKGRRVGTEKYQGISLPLICLEIKYASVLLNPTQIVGHCSQKQLHSCPDLRWCKSSCNFAAVVTHLWVPIPLYKAFVSLLKPFYLNSIEWTLFSLDFKG